MCALIRRRLFQTAEPIAPVTGVSLKLYEYPSGTPFACDGSDVADFNNLRIEVKATVAATPSEHFTVRLTVKSSNRAGNWYALWHHQNIPPHKPRAGTWEAAQTNSYNLGKHLGMWHIRTVVKGMESGNEFEDIILFRRV